MTVSKIFLYFCLSFVGGIFIGSIFTPPILFIWTGLILGLIFISVLFKRKKLVIVGFCILFLVLGIWRYETTELRIMKSELRQFNDSEEKITLIGVISDEPDLKEKSQKLTIEAESLNGTRIEEGRVLITVYRYPEYKYGDKLKAVGKLKTPSDDINGFNYRDYLKKDGIYSVMDFPKMELIGQGFGNPVMKTLFSFKNKFKETAQQFISPPQEGVLEALVFGDEENISKEWKDKLNFTGTRHITAVSGMNITIISVLLLNFLLALGLWRSAGFLFFNYSINFIYFNDWRSGFGVRAGIMAGVFLTAQHFGRMSAASRAVVFASTFMLLLNPLLLKLDVGFQLSFLAILGMIYLQPIFSDFLKKVPNFKFFPLKTTLSATLSAQVFTLPILVYNFGYIPLISPIANILIVPFLAPITILIFVFGLFGMIFGPLGYILSWPTWLCLTYIIGDS